MSLKWDGMKEFKKALHDMPETATKSVSRTLYQEGEKIMMDSKRNYTPWDLGALVNSGHVKKPTKKGSTVTVELGYGGAASAYAEAVHEAPNSPAPKSWANGVTFQTGGPQYLKKPHDKAKKRVLKRIDKDLGRAMGKKV
jgi:hypothetical protein